MCVCVCVCVCMYVCLCVCILFPSCSTHEMNVNNVAVSCKFLGCKKMRERQGQRDKHRMTKEEAAQRGGGGDCVEGVEIVWKGVEIVWKGVEREHTN